MKINDFGHIMQTGSPQGSPVNNKIGRELKNLEPSDQVTISSNNGKSEKLAGSNDTLAETDPEMNKPRFGMTDGNHVTVLQTGGGKDEIIPAMVKTGETAEMSILGQIYRYGHKKVIGLLADQAKKGVKVQLLKDPSYYNDSHQAEMENIEKYLTASGVEMINYPINQKDKIDHIKMMIIDGNKLIIGGMNWDEHSPLNKDYAVMIEGPVVGDALKVFKNDWNISGGGSIPEFETPKPAENANAKVRIVTTEEERHEIDYVLQDNIKNAKKSIKMEAFALGDKTTIANLVEAKERGVDVRVILDPTMPVIYTNNKTAKILREAGIDVKFRDVMIETREKLHSKMVTFDDDKALIGSCNFSYQGLHVNHEADVEIISDAVGLAFNNMFDHHWESEAVSKPPYIPDFHETAPEAPPKENMAKSLFRYFTDVFHPGVKRNFSGKRKDTVLSSIVKYDKTDKPAPLTTILGNSGKENLINEGQEMGAIGDVASFVNDVKNFRMDPPSGSKVPIYDRRVEICADSAEKVYQNIPRYLKDMVECIEDKDIKGFVQKALSNVPKGYLEAPSSSTGKHHPADEVDPNDADVSKKDYGPYKGGGLVLHSRRVQAMAQELCQHYGVTGKKKDEILAAMALHDVMKGVSLEDMNKAMDEGTEIPWNDTTTPDHGIVAAAWIRRMDPTEGKLTENIQRYAANHMSIWNDPPSPPEDIGEFISSMADYTVSDRLYYLDV